MMGSANGSALYIGVTNNLPRLVHEHKEGLLKGFTQQYRCHKLLYYEQFPDIRKAIAWEKQLKRWSRIKKDRLISMVNAEHTDIYETYL